MTEGYLCLHCWRILARNRAFYRCDACDASTRPGWMQASSGALRRLEDVERPWYRSLLSSDSDSRGCTHHPEARVHLFCECRYPLSERAFLRRGAPLGLGIAGPRSSGKTLLLFTMMHELRRLELAGQQLGLLGIDDTEERFHRLSDDFFSRGMKPGASKEAEPVARPWDERTGVPWGNFAWTITVAGARQRARSTALLAVYDLAGESWKLPRHETREAFDRYLGHLGSLIFVIDGGAVAADLGYEITDAWDEHAALADRGAMALQWFARVEERLGDRARRLDLALVVSKADAFWNREPWLSVRPGVNGAPDSERQATLEDLLRRSHRRDLLIEARKSFRKVRLFAASSLGFQPAASDVDVDRHLLRDIEPSGVTEPLRWLLEQRIPSLR